MASLGTIRGQMLLDVKQALAAYTAVRLAHLTTVTALGTGGAALRTAGLGLAAVGVGMGAAIYMAVNAAAEFERKLDYFSAVSASTQEEYDAIREKALELGKDTIYSAGQIADSFVELGKAGVSATDIVGGIGEAVANLGAAADIPLDSASQIIMSVVQTFGMAADEAVSVADKLAGSANASIIDVQDLGVSMKYAGGVARALGISFDDTNTALALLGNYGIKGSTAGTSLRKIMISLAGATPKATKALQSLGIITEDGTNKFFDAEGRAKSLSEVFQTLQEATAGLNDREKLDVFRDIFQIRALPSVVALTQEGADGFANMYSEIGKTTAMDVANERLDNFSGDLEILRGNIETLAIEAGSQLQAFARGVVQGFTEVIQWFSNLDDDTQALILKLFAFAAVGLVVVGFLGLLTGAFLNLIAFAIKLGDVFKLLRLGLLAVRVAIAGTWLAALGPIALVIAAVVAVVAIFIYLWNNVEGFRNFFIQCWENIKAAGQDAANFFGTLGTFFANLWTSIVDWARTTWTSFIDWLAAIPGRVTAFFAGVGAWFVALWTSITTSATEKWNSILEFIATIPGMISNFFSELPSTLGYIIGFAVGFVVKKFLELGTWLATTIPAIVNNVITFFSELPGKVGAFFTRLYLNVLEWMTKAYQTGTLKASELVSGIINWLTDLPGRVAAFFVRVYNSVREKMSEAAASAALFARDLVNGVTNWIKNLPLEVANFFQNMVNETGAKFALWLGKARNGARDIVNAIRNGISGLPRIVGDILQNVVNAFLGVIGNAWQAAKDFSSGLWEGFKDGLGIRSPSFIEHAMWDITGVVAEETKHLAGQISGIQRLGAKLRNTGQGLSSGVGIGVEEMIHTLAQQVDRANNLKAELASLGATARILPESALGNQALSGQRGPTHVINQEVTNINPVAERDSVSTNKSLQFAAAF